jgi:hypothetical protein
MTDVTLVDSWTKLDWADKNFKVLRAEIEAVEQADTHRITAEPDPETLSYVFRVYDLPPIGVTWGLRLGDIIHSARCALDYLVVRLYTLATGADPIDVGKNIDFPIFSDQKRFNSSPTAAEFRNYPVLRGWLTRIEELQPYNAGNPSIWGWKLRRDPDQILKLPRGLERLSELDNIDKHRCVLHPWHEPIMWGGDRLPIPSNCSLAGYGTGGMNVLIDGAEIGRYQFSDTLPADWQPNQVDMKRAFPVQVCFREPSANQSVTGILAWCLASVKATLDIFEPVFSRHEAPLPVTSKLM